MAANPAYTAMGEDRVLHVHTMSCLHMCVYVIRSIEVPHKQFCMYPASFVFYIQAFDVLKASVMTSLLKTRTHSTRRETYT